jgi:hypothetical protein
MYNRSEHVCLQRRQRSQRNCCYCLHSLSFAHRLACQRRLLLAVHCGHATTQGPLSGALRQTPLCFWQENLWKTEACSLHHSRPIETARDETVFKRMLLRLFGFYTRESRLLRGAKALHAAIQEQAASPALYESAELAWSRFGSACYVLRAPTAAVLSTGRLVWQMCG